MTAARAPLVVALGAHLREEYLIIEGCTPATRHTDTARARGPFGEDELRRVLAQHFGLAPAEIESSVRDAQQRLHRMSVGTAPSATATDSGSIRERRDFASRAAWVQRLVGQLVASAENGITLADLPDDVTAPLAERILKPLAIRGLVKVEGGRWAPRASLLAGVNLPLRRE